MSYGSYLQMSNVKVVNDKRFPREKYWSQNFQLFNDARKWLQIAKQFFHYLF